MTWLIGIAASDKVDVRNALQLLPAPNHVVRDEREDDVIVLVVEVLDGVEEVALSHATLVQNVATEFDVVGAPAVDAHEGQSGRLPARLSTILNSIQFVSSVTRCWNAM